MSAVIPFLLRNWQAVLGALAVLLLAALLHIRTGQRDDARNALRHCRQDHALFIARTAAEAARVRAEFEARARRVEADQSRINQEVSREYQARLAALRADYERRLRPQFASSGRPGTPGMPALPRPARGPDGPAAAGPIDEFACEANTLQLDFLQRWVRAQASVDRDNSENSSPGANRDF
jgi:hypothetical protein